jgi:hypothetical protein
MNVLYTHKKHIIFFMMAKTLFFDIHTKEISPGVFVSPAMFTHPNQSTNPSQRFSSYPFIAGDSFRIACDFIIDETNIPFEPAKVKPGDTIFLNADLMDYFFLELHPKINSPYILVTHNSDNAIPGKYSPYINDHKLIAWFGQNVGLSHDKMIHIPIGIANNYWEHGNTTLLSKTISKAKNSPKKYLLYLNVSTGTNTGARSQVFSLFSKKHYCYSSPRKPWHDYLIDLSQSYFVLSPEGNGLDCHRTWEALLMGAIPIVKTSTLDPMYQDLPVIIVQQWENINEQFLRNAYEKIKQRSYNLEKLYVQYWINLINKTKYQFQMNHHEKTT